MNTEYGFRLRLTIASVVMLSGCTLPQIVSSPAPDARPSASTPTASPTPNVTATFELLPPEPAPAGATDEFKTDFSRHIVPY